MTRAKPKHKGPRVTLLTPCALWSPPRLQAEEGDVRAEEPTGCLGHPRRTTARKGLSTPTEWDGRAK